jgi:hypothetical protein
MEPVKCQSIHVKCLHTHTPGPGFEQELQSQKYQVHVKTTFSARATDAEHHAPQARGSSGIVSATAELLFPPLVFDLEKKGTR